MNKSSYIALIGISLMCIIVLFLGSIDIQLKKGDNLLEVVLLAIRNYLLLIGFISVIVGMIMEMKIVKEKESGEYTAIDTIVAFVSKIVVYLGLLSGVFGIAGYLL